MKAKQVWYTILAILPVYGAYNSVRSFDEPWSGLIAGVIVAGILFGLSEGVLFLARKFQKKTSNQDEDGT